MAEVWNAVVGRGNSRQIPESSTLVEDAPSLVRDAMTCSLLADTSARNRSTPFSLAASTMAWRSRRPRPSLWYSSTTVIAISATVGRWCRGCI